MLAFLNNRFILPSSWRKIPGAPRLWRSLGLVLTALVWTLAFIVSPAPPALAAEVDDETAFVSRINSLRSEQGLAPLAIDTELVSASRQWATQLGQSGVLSHAPDLSVGVTSEWAKLGENVGVADSDQFEELFNAFVNSPSHYANLVDPSFTHIGTGVVYDGNGRMWTTHRFMDKVGATTTTLPPSPSATTSETAPATSPSSSTTVTTLQGSETARTTGPTTSQGLAQAEDGRPVLHAIPAEPVDPELLTNLFARLYKTA